MTRVWYDRAAGFCPGVRAAVDGALGEAAHRTGAREATAAPPRGSLLAYGPLVHNREVLDFLERRGIRTVASLEEVGAGDTLLLRAHGISPEEEKQLRRRRVDYRDFTCPRVRRVHRLIRAARRAGRGVLVVGDPEHPEVKAHLGHAGPAGAVISTLGEARRHRCLGPQTLVAQTTSSAELLAAVAAELRAGGAELTVHDTICPHVRRRQRWVENTSREAGATLVIGSRSSSNTARLAEIAARQGPCFRVEEAAQLDLPRLLGYSTLAVTAGASTPEATIRAVLAALESAGALVEER